MEGAGELFLAAKYQPWMHRFPSSTFRHSLTLTFSRKPTACDADDDGARAAVVDAIILSLVHDDYWRHQKILAGSF